MFGWLFWSKPTVTPPIITPTIKKEVVGLARNFPSKKQENIKKVFNEKSNRVILLSQEDLLKKIQSLRKVEKKEEIKNDAYAPLKDEITGAFKEGYSNFLARVREQRLQKSEKEEVEVKRETEVEVKRETEVEVKRETEGNEVEVKRETEVEVKRETEVDERQEIENNEIVLLVREIVDGIERVKELREFMEHKNETESKNSVS